MLRAPMIGFRCGGCLSRETVNNRCLPLPSYATPGKLGLGVARMLAVSIRVDTTARRGFLDRFRYALRDGQAAVIKKPFRVSRRSLVMS